MSLETTRNPPSVRDGYCPLDRLLLGSSWRDHVPMIAVVAKIAHPEQRVERPAQALSPFSTNFWPQIIMRTRCTVPRPAGGRERGQGLRRSALCMPHRQRESCAKDG